MKAMPLSAAPSSRSRGRRTRRSPPLRLATALVADQPDVAHAPRREKNSKISKSSACGWIRCTSTVRSSRIASSRSRSTGSGDGDISRCRGRRAAGRRAGRPAGRRGGRARGRRVGRARGRRNRGARRSRPRSSYPRCGGGRGRGRPACAPRDHGCGGRRRWTTRRRRRRRRRRRGRLLGLEGRVEGGLGVHGDAVRGSRRRRGAPWNRAARCPPGHARPPPVVPRRRVAAVAAARRGADRSFRL